MNFTAFGEEVPDDLLQPGCVPHDQPHVGVEPSLQPDALRVGRRSHHVHRLLHDGMEVEGFGPEPELARDDASDVEQVFDELILGDRVAHDRLDGSGVLVRGDRS